MTRYIQVVEDCFEDGTVYCYKVCLTDGTNKISRESFKKNEVKDAESYAKKLQRVTGFEIRYFRMVPETIEHTTEIDREEIIK